MTAAQGQPAPGAQAGLPPRLSPTISGKTVLWVVGGIGAVITVLLVVLYIEMHNKPRMDAAPVGAGAGRTGLYNEYLGSARERNTKTP